MSFCIDFKCGWSGQRYKVSTNENNNNSKIIASSTTIDDSLRLLELQQQITLPDSFWQQGQVVYLRRIVPCEDWKQTTLSQLSFAESGGNYLITLQYPKMDKSVGVKEAVECLLSNNFDVESMTCLLTLCKLVDNLLKTSPNDPSKRTLNLSNATLQQKVFSKEGGTEFLIAIGFEKKDATKVQLYRQDNTLLLSARSIILQTLQNQLSCPSDKLPSLKPPPIYQPPPTTTSTNEFNPYQTQNYNTQVAARGGTNPILQKDRNISTTERQLQLLQNKQTKLERQIQTTTTTTDRNILAFHNHQHYSAYSSPQQQLSDVTSNVSDGSLLASQMKRKEEERKKREEGGFTTKAMRDLERMKKQKVYSHVQLRINFPDGSFLTAKFLPRETVQNVISVIQSCFVSSMLEFDVFASPPRRLLTGNKSLLEEGLVPAAKLHVIWKGKTTQPSTDFLKPELFPSNFERSPMVSYPDAKPIVETEKQNNNTKNVKKTNKNNREEAMIRKMMGKSSSLLRRGTNDDKKKSNSNGTPKWFQK